MSEFEIGALRARQKPAEPSDVAAADQRAAAHGFVPREPVPVPVPVERAGNPRTGQVHARVLPPIHIEIASEARRRGVQQGVLIEEMWASYKAARGRLE
jgi:hypothetical protein